MNILRFLSTVVVLSTATVGAAHASVIVVQSTSAVALQAAIDSAADGDTLLVKGGGPFWGVNVIGKSLTIAAEPIGSVVLGGVRVEGLAANATVSVSGFHMQVQSPVASLVQVTNCAGAVRFSNLGHGGLPGLEVIGARVENSGNVVFTRCELGGTSSVVLTSSTSTDPEVGLLCVAQSRIALFDCYVSGGRGRNAQIWPSPSFAVAPPGPGANGAEIDGSSMVFASNTSFRGGDGGNGANSFCLGNCHAGHAGGAGGTALEVLAGSSVKLVDGNLQGGAGGIAGVMASPCCPAGPAYPQNPNGPMGAASSGSVTTLGVPTIELTFPPHLRVNQSASIVVKGTPGDEVFLAASTTPTWLDVPALYGTLVAGPQLRRIALGTIPGNGTLQTTLAFPELAGVTQAFRLHVQVVAVSPTLGPRLGTGQAVCLLGATY